MILHRKNCGLANDIQELAGEILRNKSIFSIVLTLAVLGVTIQYNCDAYGATNDKLDVNMNIIYLGTRSQKGANSLSEGVFQYPLPLTGHARQTGQGPFGGITYFDIKTLDDVTTTTTTTIPTPTPHTVVTNTTQRVTEIGLGRIYYSYSVPGETPYTFVPFVTFMRQFSYSFLNPNNVYDEVKGRSFLLPGVMYAYRFNEKVALHFDSELYSYRELNHNRSRFGFSYSPQWPWIFSISHERHEWDIDKPDIFVDGISRESNIKVIFRDPPQGNFAFTIGHGHLNRNAVGSGLSPTQQGSSSTSGTYFGVEASGGVLAW
jgi:hypothetical protein